MVRIIDHESQKPSEVNRLKQGDGVLLRDFMSLRPSRRMEVVFVYWLAVTTILVCLAYVELTRIRERNVFLFSLPWDAPPTWVELHDAAESANRYFAPAIAVVIAVTTLTFVAIQAGVSPSIKRLPKNFLFLFIVSAVADAVTTLYFCHISGLQREIHPGIRLFGYAYGRSTGIFFGKIVQVIGILAFSTCLGRANAIFLAIAAGLCSFAAIWNLTQSS